MPHLHQKAFFSLFLIFQADVRIDMERAENGRKKPDMSKAIGFCPGQTEGGSGRRKRVRWNLEEDPEVCLQEQKRENPDANEGPSLVSTVIFVRAANK